MNESMKRERAYRMQTLYRQSPNNISHQPRKIAVLAILLFAISGLVSGFAVGAFVHPGTGTGNTSNTDSLTTPGAQNNKTAVSTGTLTPVKLGWPVFMPPYAHSQKADATTSYTINIQIVDQSISQEKGNPVSAPGITCKIWLTKDDNITDEIQANNNQRLKSVDTINEPFPGEILGALNFDPGTPQTQQTNGNGQVTWKYTIATSVDPGDYHLVVLADWNGVHYNWSWLNITIKKAD